MHPLVFRMETCAHILFEIMLTGTFAQNQPKLFLKSLMHNQEYIKTNNHIIFFKTRQHTTQDQHHQVGHVNMCSRILVFLAKQLQHHVVTTKHA